MNPNSHKPEPQNSDNLDWLAFCYIADELDDSARTKFETRLENDSLAQQAVVDAMEQSQLIYAAVETRTHVAIPRGVTRPARQYKIAGFLFAAAAALLMIVVGLNWYSDQDSNQVTGADSESLAAAWVVYTMVSLDDQELDEILDEEEPLVDPDSESADDWMFVALAELEDSLEGAQ